MSLREDAVAIWKSGVDSVDSAAAVQRAINATETHLLVGGRAVDRRTLERIEVVGAGKAGAGMATGIETALLPCVSESQLSGWVNVPADCVRRLKHIHLHAARPPGINEPTQAAVDGTEEILNRVRRLTSGDLCIVLLSGGASALLCSPTAGITLDDKIAVTRALASCGAPIHELNLVRTQLSQVKGGRLAASCSAGQLIALIISDVIGNPLEVIGSGPTVESKGRPEEALRILDQRGLLNVIPASVISHLQSALGTTTLQSPRCSVTNSLVGSNEIALAAAARKAEELGYHVESLGSMNAGDAADHGRTLMHRMRELRMFNNSRRHCILSGGEPTVNLKKGNGESSAGIGGRNQELVLAAIAAFPHANEWSGLALLSGGTDGEDGPTDSAGAVADAAIVALVERTALPVNQFLGRHDSWTFFSLVDGLLKTGPTHTNVMDLRVGLVGP
jgi:glycerate 2-kinase